MPKNTKTTITVSFGNNIRHLRKSRGLSQEEFSELSGLDRSYIGGVERGDRNISLNNIKKIADALSLPMEKLFKDLNE
jgi:transcriptional regulator with XRE-family HTH domain